MNTESIAGTTFLKIEEVMRRTGLAKSTVYREVKEGRLSAPIKLGPRASAWSNNAVERWMADRLKEANQ